MPVNPETTVRKNFSFPRDLWEKVEDFRYSHRIGTESKAIARLVTLGMGAEPLLRELLTYLDQPPTNSEPDQARIIAQLRQLLDGTGG